MGLAQGFEIYQSSSNKKNRLGKKLIGKVNAATKWIVENPGGKFFLFLHTFEVHHPYTPRPEYLELFDPNYSGDLPDRISVGLLREINKGKRIINDQDRDHIISAYDAEIRSMDEAFGNFVDFLKRCGLYDNTMIIFTSDHGEEFGEHGK